MAFPSRIQDLVNRFTQNFESYKGSSYNETRARIEFIDPFFKELGWDIDNTQSFAEAYKDVIHEDAIKVEGSTKAPDYSFRIGGQRKFFLEAKKPSVNVKDDLAPAYQLRRYAWNAGLPVSILTDFEEFAIYDTTIRPNPKDKASTARIFYCTFKEYAEHWDYISSVFSKDSILKGSFDHFVKDAKKRKGTTAVDKEFLKEMEKWRNDLAKNIALRNTIEINPLNYVVQATIDRVLFLRICEDRNIEEYGRLQKLAASTNIYKQLTHFFEQADEKYNSGLFHFHKEKDVQSTPDEISLSLKIDDKILKEIITALYYPSPYEFSVISADILGNVYEQFLGKVIRLTSGGQAKVEEKPDVKKAGGVYYTPQYIVKYIVENTLGELLKEKTPMMVAGKVKSHSPLRVLDPACGSGSFLIYAYQFLLDWHRDWYEKDIKQKGDAQAKKWQEAVYQGPGDHWYLTTREKKRILVNSIFGVDIDIQAVEVTKLNLLLKVLEGENRETLGTNLKLFQERALPDLAENIKCGNSLIGSDFHMSQNKDQNDLFGVGDGEKYSINAFDWDKEFPDVFNVGGFDVVIGNPPYVRIQGFPAEQINYFSKKYQSAIKNYDLYVNFIEKGLSLLKANGLLGEILPNKFFKTDYGLGLRKLLSQRKVVSKIIDFGSSQVFDATTYTCLLFLSSGGTSEFDYKIAEADEAELKLPEFRKVSIDSLDETPWSFSDKKNGAILKKLKVNTVRLLDLPAEMSRGSSSGDDEVFVVERGKNNFEKEVLRSPLYAQDFNRYEFKPTKQWDIIFPYKAQDSKFDLYTEEELKKLFPKAYSYLFEHQAKLKKRKQFRKWYGFSAPRNLELHNQAQIAVPLLANKGLFSLIPKRARSQLCPMASGGFTITISETCKLSENYLLGLLNSKLLFWNLENLSNIFRGGWITCTKQYVGELPIKVVDFTNKKEKNLYDQIEIQVTTIINAKENLPRAKTPDEKNRLQRQVDATDREIDKLVYELYELTDEEIKIIDS